MSTKNKETTNNKLPKENFIHQAKNYEKNTLPIETIASIKKYNVNTTISHDGTLSYSKQLSHSDLLPGIYEGGFKLWECMYTEMEMIFKLLNR